MRASCFRDTVRRLSTLARAILEAKKKQRSLLKLVFAQMVLIFAFVILTGFLTWGVVEFSKETHLSAGGTLAGAGADSDKIVKTRTAQVYLPLTVAPAMSAQRLATVESVNIIFKSPPPDLWPPSTTLLFQSSVERIYRVHSVTKLSDAEIWFRSLESHVIHVKDGEVRVMALADNGSVLWSRDACSAGVECAAIRVDSEQELAELTRRAAAASPHGGRRLEACTFAACVAFDKGYDTCNEVDKAAGGNDAAPACIALVIEELGQTGAFLANGDSLTCSSLASSNLQVAGVERVDSLCAWTKLREACPMSCASSGRRLGQHDHEGLQESATRLIAHAFDDVDEFLEEQLEAKNRGDRTLKELC